MSMEATESARGPFYPNSSKGGEKENTNGEVISTPPPPSVSNYTRSDWSSTIFEIQKDEESCWWGFWCCCIVSARNAASFEIGSAEYELNRLVVVITFLVLCFVVLPPIIAVACFSSAAIFYAYYRATNRTLIREKLNIPGTIGADCSTHVFCTTCAVCQESREAKINNFKTYDYCSGQELRSLLLPSSSAPSSADDQINEREFLKLSVASKRLLTIFGLVMVVVILAFAAVSIVQIPILLLIFTQPLVLFYVFYWRTRRTKVMLDYVVKTFIVGFFVSTSQSFVIEYFLQFIFSLLFSAALGGYQALNGMKFLTGSEFAWEIKPSYTVGWVFYPLYRPTGALYPFTGGVLRAAFTTLHMETISAINLMNTNDFGWPTKSTTPAPSRAPSVSQVASLSTDSFSSSYFSAQLQQHEIAHRFLATGTDDNNYDADDSAEFGSSKKFIRRYLFLFVIAAFVMAFVIAAGVEETIKHFAVRCCRFPTLLRSPHEIFVYLMSSALGFATAENIEYVLGVKQSPIPGTGVVVGELYVLLIRVLLPIHVICSVLQAANMSKAVMGLAPQQTIFQLLIPSIFLHGIFDFVIFLLGILQYAYDLDHNTAMRFFTVFFPIFFVLTGSYWARSVYKPVEAMFENNWRSVTADDENQEMASNQLYGSEQP